MTNDNLDLAVMTTSTTCPFLQLPPELVLDICTYLDPEDIATLRRCCKEFEALTFGTFSKQLLLHREAVMMRGESLRRLYRISKNSKLSPEVRHLRLWWTESCCHPPMLTKYEREVEAFMRGSTMLVDTLCSLSHIRSVRISYCKTDYHCSPDDLSLDATFPRIVAAIEASGCKLHELRCDILLSPMSLMMWHGDTKPGYSCLSSIQHLSICLDAESYRYGEEELDDIAEFKRYFPSYVTNLRKLTLRSDDRTTAGFALTFFDWLQVGKRLHNGQVVQLNDNMTGDFNFMIPLYVLPPSFQDLTQLTLERIQFAAYAFQGVVTCSPQLKTCVLRCVCLQNWPIWDDDGYGCGNGSWSILLKFLAQAFRRRHCIAEFLIENAAEFKNKSDTLPTRTTFGKYNTTHYLSSFPGLRKLYNSTTPEYGPFKDDESSVSSVDDVTETVSTMASPHAASIDEIPSSGDGGPSTDLAKVVDGTVSTGDAGDSKFSQWLSEMAEIVRNRRFVV